MSFCVRCGGQIPDGAMFCPNCGNAVNVEKRESNNSSNVNQTVYGNVPQGFVPLKTDHSFGLLFLLSLVTCGIYGLIEWAIMFKELSTACEWDGKGRIDYLLTLLLSIPTCGIYGIIVFYNAAERIKINAARYGIEVKTSGASFLLWSLLGSLLCGVGPFIAANMMIEDINKLNAAYNSHAANNIR